jgi:hypothetical protein
MKTKSLVLGSLLIASSFLLPSKLKAQDDIGDLFKSSPQDASKLMDAYMEPLFKGLGIGLNSSWTNTAKTKSLLRFDLRFGAAVAFVPTSDQTYNTSSLGLNTIKPAAGSTGIGPTAFGDDVVGSKMEIYTSSGTPTGQTFNLPQGLGIHVVPAPHLQLTVGLPKHLDVTVRFVPDVKIGDDAGKISQYGIGLKAEILPLLLGKKDKLLPFDLAVALGYTNTAYLLPLDVNNGKYTNQEVKVKFKGFNAEAIISKRLLFFTPFASVGFNSSNSSLNANGTYDFQTAAGTATFNDPIALKHNDISALKASLGFQLNLAFLRLYASYTASDYSYASAGIGFGIGK